MEPSSDKLCQNWRVCTKKLTLNRKIAGCNGKRARVDANKKCKHNLPICRALSRYNPDHGFPVILLEKSLPKTDMAASRFTALLIVLPRYDHKFSPDIHNIL